MMYRILLVVMLGTSWAQAQSISSIAGTVSDGSALTITGTSFGTKAVAAPTKYDDFEGGTDGANIGNSWDLRQVGGDALVPTYSNVITRTGSTLSARSNFTGGQWNSSFGLEDVVDPITQIYIDGWVHSDQDSPYSRNVKYFRVKANDDGGVEQPNLSYTGFCGNSGVIGQDGVSSSPSSNYTVWTGVGNPTFANTWIHLQAWLVASSDDTVDGLINLWLNGVHEIQNVNIETRDAGDNTWDTVWIGNFFAHDAISGCNNTHGDAYNYWDDVYIDVYRQRVEVGNNAVYADTTHREIQIPTAWSDTEITVTLNQGSLTGFNNQYLFVVGSDGTASPGFLLSGADPPPPPETDEAPLRFRASVGDRLYWDGYTGDVDRFEVSTDGLTYGSAGLVMFLALPLVAGLYPYWVRPCNTGGCAEATQVEVEVVPEAPPSFQGTDFRTGP